MYDIIVKENSENQEILVVENGILTERILADKTIENIEGNIYMGRVQNIIPGLQAAFVNIGEDKNTFIHLKDILPKVDESSKEANNENVSIQKVIKPGMPILVQVKRNESNKKGARVSTHISLSGKYLVLMPNAAFITVSQKIENQKESERLKKSIKEMLPKGMGAIIRTSAENKKDDILKKEVDELLEEWRKIEKKSKEIKENPFLIYDDGSFIKRILNDLTDKQLNSIIVDNAESLKKIRPLLKEMPKVSLKLGNDSEINQELQKQIEEIDKRKIWLKCGGFITIDKTEALTAIDVNSGKYIGDKNLEQTVYTVNKEATVEIAKQLRLKDIGGIIIIDYIDMNDEKDRQKIESLLKEQLKKDRSKTQILGFTKLNLLEMTRKHIN